MSTGLPPLLNKANNLFSKINLVSADIGRFAGFFQQPPWGIYYNGNKVLEPDSVIRVQYRKEWNIPNYPQEQGAFETYNKVNMPFSARVSMAKGGTDTDRNQFLQEVDNLAESYALYDVVTPEITYLNANVSHVEYERTATNGYKLIIAHLWLVEIRVTVPASYSNTAAPSGNSPYQGGTVQAQPASSALSKAVSSILSNN